jgi:hypothetical protein
VHTGRNRANKLVHFRAAMGNGKSAIGEPRIGELVHVEVTRTTAWSLQGRLPAAVPA